MLKEGDLIMHETAGVCRVTGETTLDGLTGVYYILCPLYMKDATFYTPRDNGKVKIRPIMTKSLYEEQSRRAKRGKKSSLNDSTLLKKAELLLFGELATALEIELDQVQDFIAEKLSV